MAKNNTQKPETRIEPKTALQQDTTIKISPDLKEVLGKMKTDPDEPYAGVIRRLITRQTEMNSTQETITITIDRSYFNLVMMMDIPPILKEALRRGVR